MAQIEKVRNIGISAHIDSGKTTLTERILFYTGRIHAIHEVQGKDGVGAKMDSMDLEREKGITIQSAATYCAWGEHQHQHHRHARATSTSPSRSSARCASSTAPSWCSCSVAGVQSQSITVDRQMRRYKVPRIAFINKMDRAGAQPVPRHAAAAREARPQPGASSRCRSAPRTSSRASSISSRCRPSTSTATTARTSARRRSRPSMLDEAQEAPRRDARRVWPTFDDDARRGVPRGRSSSRRELMRGASARARIELKCTPVIIGSALQEQGRAAAARRRRRLPAEPDAKSRTRRSTRTTNEAKVMLESDPTSRSSASRSSSRTAATVS